MWGGTFLLCPSFTWPESLDILSCSTVQPNLWVHPLPHFVDRIHWNRSTDESTVTTYLSTDRRVPLQLLTVGVTPEGVHLCSYKWIGKGIKLCATYFQMIHRQWHTVFPLFQWRERQFCKFSFMNCLLILLFDNTSYFYVRCVSSSLLFPIPPGLGHLPKWLFRRVLIELRLPSAEDLVVPSLT